MITITYKKKGIRITQIWFPNDSEKGLQNNKTDVFFVHGVEKSPGEKAYFQKFHTLITDLVAVEEEQYGRISKNVRYEIRRNQKEDVTFKVYTSNNILEDETLLAQFADMYTSMYETKGMKQFLNTEQLKLYAKENSFLISAMEIEDEPVVMHSYIVGEEDVRLLHSISEFRKENVDANFIARCNKRLHWEDMCYFSQKSKKRYDWGGVSDLENPNGIDAFKFKFGGSPCTYYNKYTGKSLLGKLIVTVLKIRHSE